MKRNRDHSQGGGKPNNHRNQKRPNNNGGGNKHHRGTRLEALGDPRGYPGILFTADDKREKKAMYEISDLLNNEIEELYPNLTQYHQPSENTQQDHNGTSSTNKPNTGDSITALSSSSSKPKTIAEELAEELAALDGRTISTYSNTDDHTNSTNHHEKRVSLEQKLSTKRARWLDLNTRAIGMIWINNNEHINILTLIDKIFDAALQTKQCPTRFTTRILPLHIIVAPYLKSIIQGIEYIIPKIFSNRHYTNKDIIKYRIEFRTRSNNNIHRHELVAEIVNMLSTIHVPKPSTGNETISSTTTDIVSTTSNIPSTTISESNTSSSSSSLANINYSTLPQFVPDTENPDTIIVIEIVKNYAGIGILPEYRWTTYDKYNIRLVSETSEDKERRLNKLAEEAARAEKRRNIETTDDGKQIWIPNNTLVSSVTQESQIRTTNNEDDNNEGEEDNNTDDETNDDIEDDNNGNNYDSKDRSL